MRVAIIPARGGSVRVPRKNVKPFRGRPIIEYSIEAAQKAKHPNHNLLFDQVIVSTDDLEIAELANAHGCAVHQRRPCDGTMGTQEVAALAMRALFRPTVACVIYATCPMLEPADLERGYATLIGGHGTLRYAMSVQADPLADAGCFYWGWAASFLAGHPIIDTRTAMVPLPAERSIDINTLEDWARAESMFDALRRAT